MDPSWTVTTARAPTVQKNEGFFNYMCTKTKSLIQETLGSYNHHFSFTTLHQDITLHNILQSRESVKLSELQSNFVRKLLG